MRLKLQEAGLVKKGKAKGRRYLREAYLSAHNTEFRRGAHAEGSAFMPPADPGALDNILCEKHTRVVGRDNCVQFGGSDCSYRPTGIG